MTSTSSLGMTASRQGGSGGNIYVEGASAGVRTWLATPN